MARERDYQLGIVINPDVGEDQARTVVERVNGLIDSNGGHVIRVLAWGRRRLAYPIEHHRDGLFFWFDMQLPPPSVAEIERQLHVQEAIIRHLITLRDSRVVVTERQRAEEAEARAAAEAESRAAQAAEAVAQAQAAEEAQPASIEATAPEAAPSEEAAPEPTAEAAEAEV